MTPSQPYAVLIPTSGVGGPLGGITQFTNKSLIKVGKKPTLSYILETYPTRTDFVVTVGHFADQVRDFIRLVYPHLNVTFVEVDKYDGPGSSLAYSMLQAKRHLERPFIYHASDTIVTEPVPSPDRNWMAGYKAAGSAEYASFDVLDGHIQHLYDKGVMAPDYLHIGIVGIHDHQGFWKQLQTLHTANANDQGLGDVRTIQALLKNGTTFSVKEVAKWYDVGNIDSLNRVRAAIPDSFRVLDKLDESIFLFDDFVVKFYADPAVVAQRVKRGELLKGLVPQLVGSAKNFYKYRYVEGRLFSTVATPQNFHHFLGWSQTHLWKPVQEVGDEKFEGICYDFYYTKTLKRVKQFQGTRSVKDETTRINEESVPPLQEMLAKVDFRALSKAPQMQFHGDFILDNILKTDDGYCLLDWRQNFGGLLKAGDQYYDLAKLNHNLTINHEVINKNLFTIQVHDQTITCDILRPHRLVACQDVLMDFLKKNKYDVKQVKLLTAIIWLNMSPLHHHPFDLFLYYFGKFNLLQALKEQ